MSKGKQPPGRSIGKASTIAVRDAEGGAALGEGASYEGAQQNKRCWRFNLVEPSSAVKKATIDMDISGSPNKSRVLIYSSIGALGFAPDAKAKEMIQAKSKKQGDLVGRVILINASRTNLEVELCLI